MTPGPGGRRPWISPLWSLPLGIAAGVGASVAAGVTSKAVILDLVAWWPVWLGLVAFMVVSRDRYLGRLRLSGLVPLVALAVAVIFVTGHVQGWAAMPSAGGRLIGPEPAFDRASLVADVDGRMMVTGDAAFLYEVYPIRWGGDVGIPDALEQSGDGTIAVTLRAPGDPRFQSFAGWELRVSPGPEWDLTLGGVLDADLSALTLTGLALSGEGRITLGGVERLAAVGVSGDFVLRFVERVPVRVVGEALVPEGWERLSDGWHSPFPGTGWVVTVEDGARLMVEAGG